MKIRHQLTVTGVLSEPPFVRVHGYFLEGGTPNRSHDSHQISFLCSSHEAPRVGDKLALTIKPWD